MLVYVSGPIKDVPDHQTAFLRGCDAMRDAGHEPINPCELDHADDATYEDFMREDIRALLDCGAVFMLDGWERSVGARTEHLVAAVCGLRIWYESAPYVELITYEQERS